LGQETQLYPDRGRSPDLPEKEGSVENFNAKRKEGIKMVVILVVTTIICFILIDLAVQTVEARREGRVAVFRSRTETQAAGEARKAERKPVRSFRESDYRIPMGIFFHKGHTWANLLLSGYVKVGMDDFAQRSIGRFDEIELPPIGKEVKQGGRIFTIKQGNRKANFYSPVDGVIGSVNHMLLETPRVIKRDPYIDGWVCAIKPNNLSENIKALKVAKDAALWLKEEIVRFKEVMLGKGLQMVPGYATIQDGGEIVDGLLEFLGDEQWEFFEKNFLRKRGR